MTPDRQWLHERARAVARELAQRFGTAIPDDAVTIVRYYFSCQGAYDRAAEAVVRLERIAANRGDGR